MNSLNSLNIPKLNAIGKFLGLKFKAKGGSEKKKGEKISMIIAHLNPG